MTAITAYAGHAIVRHISANPPAIHRRIAERRRQVKARQAAQRAVDQTGQGGLHASGGLLRGVEQIGPQLMLRHAAVGGAINRVRNLGRNPVLLQPLVDMALTAPPADLASKTSLRSAADLNGGLDQGAGVDFVRHAPTIQPGLCNVNTQSCLARYFLGCRVRQ